MPGESDFRRKNGDPPKPPPPDTLTETVKLTLRLYDAVDLRLQVRTQAQ